MAKFLLIETATSVCSTAIAIDGTIAALAETDEVGQHTALLTAQIEDCVRRSGVALAELDAVAVSQGPGSYTSLRVGMSVAKGICYALDKPLIAIDTLHALAAGARDADTTGAAYFVPMLDARRQEIWVAIYNSALQEIAPAQPLIIENNSFYVFLNTHISDWQVKKAILTGNGTAKVVDGSLLLGTVQNVACSAAHQLGLTNVYFQQYDYQDVARTEPYYMKMPNVTTPKIFKI